MKHYFSCKKGSNDKQSNSEELLKEHFLYNDGKGFSFNFINSVLSKLGVKIIMQPTLDKIEINR